MCHWRTEQGHESVTQELVDGAFHTMDFRQCELEDLVEQFVHRVGTQTLCEIS